MFYYCHFIQKMATVKYFFPNVRLWSYFSLSGFSKHEHEKIYDYKITVIILKTEEKLRITTVGKVFFCYCCYCTNHTFLPTFSRHFFYENFFFAASSMPLTTLITKKKKILFQEKSNYISFLFHCTYTCMHAYDNLNSKYNEMNECMYVCVCI